MPRTQVISASRTKDIVRWSPDVLAAVLAGRAACRFGRGGKPHILDRDAVHTLVLWTKDPGNIVRHGALRQALGALVAAGAKVYLQLTATGLGGTFVEHNVPTTAETAQGLGDALDSGLVAPGAVKLRYDPLIFLRAGRVRLSNMRRDLFVEVLDAFAALGVEDVVTSYVDFESYPKVRRRIEAVGLEVIEVEEKAVREFVEWMAEQCHGRAMRFDTCAAPAIPFGREGCISGSRFNALMAERCGPAAPRCTTQLHNERTPGGQRSRCRCTFSRDIGYSRGFTTCYTHGSGCLYCYSHHEALGPKLLPAVQREVDALVSNPEAFLAEPAHAAYRGIASLE